MKNAVRYCRQNTHMTRSYIQAQTGTSASCETVHATIGMHGNEGVGSPGRLQRVLSKRGPCMHGNRVRKSSVHRGDARPYNCLTHAHRQVDCGSRQCSALQQSRQQLAALHTRMVDESCVLESMLPCPSVCLGLLGGRGQAQCITLAGDAVLQFLLRQHQRATAFFSAVTCH